jgi:Lar family restriction alleviation protein
MAISYTPVPGENSDESGIETAELIETALKDAAPCPWCGGAPIVDAETHQSLGGYASSRTTWVVRCRSCAGTGPWSKYSARSAISKWNKRIGPDQHP